MASMILTEQEIEDRVFKVNGTWVKRSNLRKRLKGESNRLCNEKIAELKVKVRRLKAEGARERDLRYLYAEVTKYELMIIY